MSTKKMILQFTEISKKLKVRYLFRFVSCFNTGAVLLLLLLASEMFSHVRALCEEPHRMLIHSGSKNIKRSLPTCPDGYEDSNIHICNALYRARFSTDSCKDLDVTSQIQRQCRLTSDCTITPVQLSDHCPGTAKTLVLDYTCRAREPMSEPAMTTEMQEHCKKQLSAEDPCQSKPPANFSYLRRSKKCVMLVPDEISWPKAQDICLYTMGGSLARVNTKIMDSEITDHMRRKHTTGEFWIGLHSRHLKRDGLTGFGWLQENSVAYIPTEIGFQPSTQKTNQCVAKSTSSGWITDSCHGKHKYICEQLSAGNPGPPTLTVKLPDGSRHAYVNKMLKATCSALVDKGGQLEFFVGGTHFNSSASNFILEEDQVHVTVGGRCFRRSTASFSFLVTAEMFPQSSISCSWFSDEIPREQSNIFELESIYLPRRPYLLMLSDDELKAGSFLMASCKACVGTGGKLVWSLTVLDNELEWVIDPKMSDHVMETVGVAKYPSAELEDNEYPKATITWLSERNNSCGPKLTSTFQREVRNEVHQPMLKCGFSFPYTMPPGPIEKEDNLQLPTSSVSSVPNLGLVITACLLILILLLGICAGTLVPRKKKKEKKTRRARLRMPFRGILKHNNGTPKDVNAAQKSPSPTEGFRDQYSDESYEDDSYEDDSVSEDYE